MMRQSQQGQANLTAVLLLVGVIVTGVWAWKRLPVDLQDYVIDQALPLAAALLVIGVLLHTVVRKWKGRSRQRRERTHLIAAFQRETAHDKKLELSFAVTELNGYRLKGLEPIAPALKELWVFTLRRAVGEKQYLIRGMAASHLGVLQDKTVVPLLLKALEDDHAYVRACAALGLGRLRATEARERLRTVMEEDWDQTVRSRAKEAVERLPT
jgi:hypothetical protein